MLETFAKACIFLMTIVEENLFYPGKVETATILIQTNQKTLEDLPYETLSRVIDTFQTNFPNFMDEMYLLNPSIQLQLGFNQIKLFIAPNTAEKIVILP